MLLKNTLTALLTAMAAPAVARSLFDGVSMRSEYGALGDKIPGESPLELCNKAHNDDLVTITKVDLSPNPPSPGKTLTIQADGLVHEDIGEGAYVLLTVKYGLIRLISTTADLCEQIQNVDMECPIKAGKLSIVKEVELPAEIPPGKYTVLADVYTADDKPVTCLTATVVFGPGRLMGLEL